MAHVFISYQRSDKESASFIRENLNQAGFETWIDEDISPGEKWSKAIDDAIKASFALVVMMSPAAKASEYVTYEWSFALGANVPVISILLEKTDLHPKLAELQYVDYTHPAKQNREWERLIGALNYLKQTTKPIQTTKVSSVDTELEILFNDLQDQDPEKRRNAARVLGNIGTSKATSFLIQVLDDENWSVRVEAANALGRIGDAQAVTPLLRSLQNSKSSSVRRSIVRALGAIGIVMAIPSLQQCAQFDKDNFVRTEAAIALVNIGGDEAYETIAKVVSSPWSLAFTHVAIIDALTEMEIQHKVQAAQNLLIRFLEIGDSEFQNKVASALEKIDTFEALKAVQDWRREHGK